MNVSILFIGNSFTYFHDLPKIVEEIAEVNKQKIFTKQVAYGGYRLSQYLQHRSSEYHEILDQLDSREWDYVILQDHSKGTIDNTLEFHKSVDIFNKMITNRNSKTVLYSTWSYKDNSDMLASTNLSYKDMYVQISKEYHKASLANNCLLAPVGAVFNYINKHHPEINLYDEDDYHPNVLGSFIGAYVFYNLLVGKDEHFTKINIDKETLGILKEAVMTVLKREK